MPLGRRDRRHRARKDPAPAPSTEPAAPATTSGPWDVVEAPEDGLERVDLGALLIPVIGGYDLQVEVSPEGQVVSINLVGPESAMQLGAFAAPRSSGIWDEVRREILASLSSQGGTGTVQDGAFGTELSALAPVPGGHQRIRFIGIDGPRWMLRAVISGAGATDAAKAAELEDTLRRVVVNRGDEPMPVRDALPLTLPREVAEQLAKQQGDAGPGPDGVQRPP
ncbi:MAG: DUF3710 domain-containing protein [Mycobacteriales bacterium]|nr:MAG: DUF3710 domain-containing protein [Pseudonocardiales bacterium]